MPASPHRPANGPAAWSPDRPTDRPAFAAATRRRALALLLLTVLLTGCARLGGEAHQPSHNAALPLTPETTLGQTFTVAGGSIAGLDLLMATFAKQPDPAGTLTVTLRDRLDGAVVGVAEVPGSDIEDNSWVAVRFDEPVALALGAQAAADERPMIEATWDGSSPVALRANVPAEPREPDVLVNDPYALGELVRDGELAAGDLAFRVVGTDGAAALPRTVRGLAGGLVRGLADRPLFAVGWLALLGGSTALAVWGLVGGRGRA